jgi:PKD repeat protein
MGARNPYRIFVDKDNTDWLFWGDVGPDANLAGVEGPEGLDEINLTKKAGNYGWPYFAGKNEAYLNNYSSPSFYFDPSAPVNLSIWNTGAINLPPAEPSWLELFHKSYLAGPRYYYDPSSTDLQRLPVQFDEVFFYYDFNTSQIWVASLDINGEVLSTVQLAPEVFPLESFGFIDMKIGPDGHLYILEYGAGCCPSDVATGKLIRVDYVGLVVNLPPVVNLTSDTNNGAVPLTVNFSSEGTFDPEGDLLTYAWDFQSDGIIDSNQPNPSFTYTSNGEFVAQLQVSDGNGGISSKTITIFAGNDAATFTFNSPQDGGLFNWGDDVEYELEVTDQQDGSTPDNGIDCDEVIVTPSLAHLDRFLDQQSTNGCQGSVTLKADYTIGLNSGGTKLTTDNVNYNEDQYATGGETYSNPVAIDGTIDDALYQTERYGDFSYNIPVEDPGLYDIKLHFAEIFHEVEEPGGPGDRVFTVSIEGIPVLQSFDILSEVAPATALIKVFERVSINDGVITIQFTSIKGNSKLSAIEITNSNGLDIYGADDISHSIAVQYTDKDGLTAFDRIQLYPKRHEAEFFDSQGDVTIVPNTDIWGGGTGAIRVNHNSYISFSGRNLTNVTSVKYRTTSGGDGGSIELRLDGISGPLLSSTDIPATGSWSNWSEQESSITDPGGKHDLYFVFKNDDSSQDLFELNYLEFGGGGVSVDNSPPEILTVMASSNTSVQVEFSEVVAKNTAEFTGNYLIDQAVVVSNAVLAPDSRTVLLTTSQLNPSFSYQLSVSSVENLAGLAMVADSYPFSIAPDDSANRRMIPRLKVYPNPATNQVTLELQLLTAENVLIHIYDAVGKEFYIGEAVFEAGTNIIDLDLNHLTEGLYYLKLNSRATNLAGKKLVIKK